MGDVVQLRPTQQEVPVRLVNDIDEEHVCSRQARILNAWLLDCNDSTGLDWAEAQLQRGLDWVRMRKIFRK